MALAIAGLMAFSTSLLALNPRQCLKAARMDFVVDLPGSDSEWNDDWLLFSFLFEFCHRSQYPRPAHNHKHPAIQPYPRFCF